MSKSIIYAGNSTTQVTADAGTTITFPTIVRRYGCNCKLVGGNVVCDGTGYYDGEVNLTIQGNAAGTTIVNVYENGSAIPFANATITTVSGDYVPVTIPFVVRNNCNCMEKAITVVVSGVITNVTNASIVVSKE